MLPLRRATPGVRDLRRGPTNGVLAGSSPGLDAPAAALATPAACASSAVEAPAAENWAGWACAVGCDTSVGAVRRADAVHTRGGLVLVRATSTVDGEYQALLVGNCAEQCRRAEDGGGGDLATAAAVAPATTITADAAADPGVTQLRGVVQRRAELRGGNDAERSSGWLGVCSSNAAATSGATPPLALWYCGLAATEAPLMVRSPLAHMALEEAVEPEPPAVHEVPPP